MSPNCAIRWILFVALMLWFTRGANAVDEPQSRGHTLSYWLEHWMTSISDPGERQKAETAIREIGTNGLPAMLVWLRYEPSQTKTNIMEFLKRMRQTAYGRWIPPQLTYEDGPPPAHIGFNVLGPTAAPAIPDLTQIANDAQHPRPAARALMALSAIGSAALPAVEARLANTNFPFTPIAAVNMYLRTRTSSGFTQLNDADAKPILLELQTNSNPLLTKGASQLLKSMEQPSFWQRGKTKTLSEASSELGMERGMGGMGGSLKPGWNIPAWAKLSPEEQLAASNTIQAALAAPPAQPKGDEPYPYPLQPGTPVWDYATPEERIQSVQIPKSWRDHATSWQLFRSTVGNPYFDVEVYMPGLGFDFAHSYQSARSSITVPLLKEIDTAPEFGTNILRWLSQVELEKVEALHSEKPYEPCFMCYRTVCMMATLDSALNTLDVNLRQQLYRLAIWDADYFLSKDDSYVASGPLEIIYVIAKKPESFRGPLPDAAVVKPPPPPKVDLHGLVPGFLPNEGGLRLAVAAAKSVLALKERP